MFQSTHPRRVRRIYRKGRVYPQHVSIHAPTQGATAYFWNLGVAYIVSIHAPTQGATTIVDGLTQLPGFNPRTHAGCDLKNELTKTLHPRFQSTHPRRVRHKFASTIKLANSFNPRTHAGCDLRFVKLKVYNNGFNPRTHAGCDKLQGFIEKQIKRFNPRTHAGCD